MTNSKSVDPAHNTENVSAVLIDKWLYELSTSFTEKIEKLIERIVVLEAANLAKDKEISDLKKNGQNSVASNSATFWSQLPSAATIV
jgi:hypothetical protein